MARILVGASADPRSEHRFCELAGVSHDRLATACHRCRCRSLRFLIRLPQVAMSHQAPAWLWERS